MSWLKGLMGGAAGAAGYATVSQYETKDLAQGLLSVMARDGKSSSGSAGSADPQVLELTKQVQDLQKWLQLSAQQQRQQPLTIVTTHNQRGGWTYILVPTSMLGAYLLYLRYWKGYRLSDFMYVTRSSLQSLKSSVSEGLNRVQEDMTRRTSQLAQQLGLVSGKQDHLLTQQQHMGVKMNRLGDDVEGVKANVSQMHGDVRSLQTNVDVVQRQLEWGNQGIYVLCHALSDLSKAVDFKGKSRNTIDTFLQRAPVNLPSTAASTSALPSTSTASVIRPAVGLEGLLEASPLDLASASSGPSTSIVQLEGPTDRELPPTSRGFSMFSTGAIIPGLMGSRANSINSRTSPTPI